jgi:hypothetical protein
MVNLCPVSVAFAFTIDGSKLSKHCCVAIHTAWSRNVSQFHAMRLFVIVGIFQQLWPMH